MTLSTLLAVYLGFLLECLWLVDAAGEIGKKQGAGIKAPGPSTMTRIIGITAAVGVGLIGVAELAGENTVTAFLYNLLSSVLMGAAMFFVLIAGAVGGQLLPRVNEYNIISVLLVVVMTACSSGWLSSPVMIGAVFGILLLLLVALVFQRKPPSTFGQVLLYDLYLGSLVFLGYQSDFISVLQGSAFNIREGFLAGSIYAFLSLHILFAIRFAVLSTSFLLPGNRHYAAPVMKKVYREDQVRPLVFLVLLALLIVLLLINNRLSLFPDSMFAGILAILSTQMLFRPADQETPV
ncbi:MAG: hypothetical protein JXA25_04465 [Anaerolineales bacterium]|nr:hypothetical protein [Anaerolineales bacterium]